MTMIRNSIVLILFCLSGSFCHNLKAQVFELSPFYINDFSTNDGMQGLASVHSVGLSTVIFPWRNVPLGFAYHFNFGIPAEARFSTNNKEPLVDTSFYFASFLYKNSIGIKIANPYSIKPINPYFSGMLGIGSIRSRYNLMESVSTADEVDHRETIKSARLWRFSGSIYRLEAGLEYNLLPEQLRIFKKAGKKVMGLSLFASIGYTGSFNSFEYFQPSEVNFREILDNPDSFDRDFFRDENFFNERLSYWNISIGLIMRF
jgi:hypothetical protein